jgi:hypothetical protein
MRYLVFALSVLAMTAYAQTPPVVELTNPANGAKIALKKGGELKLVFDADPAHSVQWANEGNVGPTLSQIGQRVMVSKSVNVADYTAGAWNIFRYRAEKPGNVKLTFENKRYDAPGPALRAVTYDVTVE